MPSSEGPQPLILASASPRRRELLRAAGVPFRVEVSDVHEQRLPGETAAQFTERAAAEKAERVAARCPAGVWVLGADTSVVVDGEVLGKPADAADAERMLALLSGRSHQVLTAVALRQAGTGARRGLLSTSQVTFRPLSAELIQGYVRTGEPLDKAGAYGIQGRAASLVRAVAGSYTNVVGLPLCETVELLEEVGAFRPFADARPPRENSIPTPGGGA